jgi:DHA1 family bicyclomycin/chloramphenicol resistance-like MFS transporter
VTDLPDNKPTPTPWGLVILLGTMTAFAPISIDMYLAALPAIQESLRASPADGQATLAAFLAGMAIGQVIYGPASDRFGRRGPVLLGAVIYVAASVLCALAPTIGVLIAGRFVQALGGCAGAVVARAVVRDRFGHTETARFLSLMMLVMGLAPILTPLAGGFVLLFVGWRGIFWLLAVFGIAIGAAVALFLTESRSDDTAALARSENPLRAYLALLSERRLVGYSLAGALNGAVLFTYISSSPDLVIKQYGVSPQNFGWVFAANAFGLIGASQVNRYLLRTRTPDQVLSWSSLTACGFATLMMLAAATGIGQRWTVLPLLFLTLATYGLMQGNTMAGALSVDPRRAGSISALMGAMSFAVGAVASWAAGAFHDGTPRPMAGVMLGALIGSAAALRFLALPKRG